MSAVRGLSGSILADLAANLLVVTLVVLIVLGRATALPPAQPPETLTARPVAPISGPDAVELLRQRLLPEATGLADLVPDAPAAAAPIRVLFVLDPAGYAALPLDQQTGWQELTVPQALKTPDNRWSPDFLALAEVAGDPDRFRTGLLLLLERAPHSGAVVAAPDQAGSGYRSRIIAWFKASLEVMGLCGLGLAVWALLRLRRWALTV